MSFAADVPPWWFQEYVHITHERDKDDNIIIVIMCEYCSSKFCEFQSGCQRDTDDMTAAVAHYQDKHPLYFPKRYMKT